MLNKRDYDLIKSCVAYSLNSLEKQYKRIKSEIMQETNFKECEKLFKQLRKTQEELDELSFLYQRLS